jgi:excinuclease UvrABC nuclease subunit
LVKQKNLKKRVSSYFGKSFKDRKTHQIKILTDQIETFSTITEAEALAFRAIFNQRKFTSI